MCESSKLLKCPSWILGFQGTLRLEKETDFPNVESLTSRVSERYFKSVHVYLKLHIGYRHGRLHDSCRG